jgi:drug/metabolite transporter (DMT)-like permease
LTGPAFLFLAVLIFGAANAVIRKLTEIGAAHLIDGRNPISFCNVLFVGNFCALILLLHLYQADWKLSALRKLNTQQFWAMATVACLGTALAPALVFSALAVTPVNTVVLISRIEPPLILALSVILLDERVNRWIVGGAALSFLGVLMTILLQPRGAGEAAMGLGNGEFWTALAAIALALSTIISKTSLREIPVGVFSIIRMLVGTIVFFVLAAVLFGPGHFVDVGSPFLWRWIVLYAAGIVVAGQLLWYNGLRRGTASEVSLASTLTPIAGFAAAFLILGEAPTRAQWAGGLLILVGMGLNHWGLRMLVSEKPNGRPDGKALADTLGFKGV